MDSVHIARCPLPSPDWLSLRPDAPSPHPIGLAQEDAQRRLDDAMCTESISWMNISLAGIERLLLEAVTFGRILWDVESTFGIEYHLV
eukprot:6031027-Pyramimonas_sp.AAC.1